MKGDKLRESPYTPRDKTDRQLDFSERTHAEARKKELAQVRVAKLTKSLGERNGSRANERLNLLLCEASEHFFFNETKNKMRMKKKLALNFNL